MNLEQEKNESKAAKRINIALSALRKLGQFKQIVNQRMEGKYSARLIAFTAALTALLLMILMLFVPNYLGVAGDQTVGKVMNASGVYYTSQEISDIYNNYFVRTYSNVMRDKTIETDYLNSQVLFVRVAVFLDNVFTQDRIFDIRFLAILYGIFYIPALYLLVKQACSRVNHFSEGIVIGFVGLLMFADVAYLTYFNSFYPEALQFVSLMYLVAAGLSFQENRSSIKDFWSLIIFVLAAGILLSTRGECTFLGIFFAVYCLKLLFARSHWMWGVICVMTAFIFSFFSISCMINMETEYDDRSKFHAMTRGVLFEASDPQKALEEFGIDASYELLADVSAYDDLPFVFSEDTQLKKDFLDQYTQTDIAAYYVRHPGSFINMLDTAIKSCYGIRKDYCGNYEKSVGLPPQAKSIFFGIWSTFKTNSAPKTIGFFAVLVAAVILLFRKGYSIRPDEDRRSTIFLDTMMLLVFTCIQQAGSAIIFSGDAELIQHCFLVSYGMDLMIFIVFAELVHKMKIF